MSNSEGNSYATLDALACGTPVVSTKVGLFYKDVPEDCFVSLDMNRLHPGEEDIDYILERLDYEDGTWDSIRYVKGGKIDNARNK